MINTTYMFWFLLGFAVVNFVIGAIVGYKFHSWKEYKDYTFDIDKFDILAADDGYKFRIDLDPTEDDDEVSFLDEQEYNDIMDDYEDMYEDN